MLRGWRERFSFRPCSYQKCECRRINRLWLCGAEQERGRGDAKATPSTLRCVRLKRHKRMRGNQMVADGSVSIRWGRSTQTLKIDTHQRTVQMGRGPSPLSYTSVPPHPPHPRTQAARRTQITHTVETYIWSVILPSQ